ncbi:hypothetical protein [Rhizobium sp. NZLR11]|uniref:hypothetical protein n=1 Tax=Rhizobium sp. NZLR11 TaxID=2731098 RepID=UPI00287FCF24|nr:hypothetical protein [Rhizobium sp. NZLR11]
MLAGFAFEGFIISAIFVHMVPLTVAIGLGSAGVFIASLLGPSQVASRLINKTRLAVSATAALTLGLAMLLINAPSLIGATAFAIIFGFGSGMMSIVGGTLPLELFGRTGYGQHMGWITAARQCSSAFAPFGLTFMMHGIGVFPALWINVAIGFCAIAAFAGVAIIHHRAAI